MRPPGAPASTFLGRIDELEALRERLSTTRLLSLTGPAGCGKSRLAMQLAADISGVFPDGVFVVELAAIQEPELLEPCIAGALRLRPRSGSGSDQSVFGAIADASLMLVLDNCEHLVDACARVCDQLLRQCPNLTVLVTSREALVIPGEVNWQVPPMSLPEMSPPDVEALLRADSARLFVTRAREAYRSFAVTGSTVRAIAQICNGVDGIPLALELAAARVVSMSVQDIASRLSDSIGLLTGGQRTAAARHQTLRSAIEWSHNLLSPAMKALFARLSVFPGSFDLAAVETICASDDLPSSAAVDALHALISKSMVQSEVGKADSRRYRLLAPLRQFALGRLPDQAMHQLRDQHLAYYTELVAGAGREAHQDAVSQALRKLEIEHDNFRAALDWAAQSDPSRLEHLVAMLSDFWVRRGYLVEGEKYVAHAIRNCQQEGRGSSQFELLLALFACRSGDYARGMQWINGVWAAGPQDERLLARSYLLASICEAELGDIDQARDLIMKSISLERRRGDHQRLARALNNLAVIEASVGNIEDARHAVLEAQSVSIDPSPLSLSTTHTSAMVEIIAGDVSKARDLSLRLLNAGLDDSLPELLAQGLEGLGLVAASTGSAVDAVQYFAAAERERRMAGTAEDFLWRALVDHAVGAVESLLGTDVVCAARQEGLRVSVASFLERATAGLDIPTPVASTGPRLTRRERECVELVGRGLANKEIAARLGISVRTVTTHLEHVRAKYAVHNRVEMGRIASPVATT